MQTPGRIGKYQIIREVGRGAMGVVYEGVDTAIGRTVAIKILQQRDLADAASFDEARLRFKREAQAAGQLNHPNIVAVYDYSEGDGISGAEPGGPFIAMEFVRGRNLREHLKANRRFTPVEVDHLMQQLLAALQHAHGRGVIHRDVKPSNLIICEGDTVKLADLGIARTEHSDLTATGTVLGSATYMSPEQLTGSCIDHRTDLYSCGVLLYELLTGEPPFLGSTTSIIQRILNQEALPPSLTNPALPRAVDDVLRTALAKRATDRFPTADLFAKAIAVAIRQPDPDATVLQPAEGRGRAAGPVRSRVAALATAGVMVAVAGVFLWKKKPETGPGVGTSLASAPVSGRPAAAPDVRGASSTPVQVNASSLASAPGIPSESAIEQMAWDEARARDRASGYDAYLKEFAHGSFAKLARIRLAALTPNPNGSVIREALSTPPSIGNAAHKGNEVRQTRSVELRSAASDAAVSASRTDSNSVSELIKKCADDRAADHSGCQMRIATFYRDGRSVPQDYSAAMHWYRHAADNGDPAAQYEMAKLYFFGRGTPQNYGEAVNWLSRAANQGNAAAQDLLGYACERGFGVAANPVAAAGWYRKSADKGDVSAQNNLGRAYLYGIGVGKDPVKAAALLRTAAAQGDANAAFNLGAMFEKGIGVAANDELAASWYRAALARPGLYLWTSQEKELLKAFVAAHPQARAAD